ncbi:SGNH/GDSL hydrolase family protein [Dyadobacter luticola]|nr:SGNH/GDSL hydrolase family protein [Dyadobacter luticola]
MKPAFLFLLNFLAFQSLAQQTDQIEKAMRPFWEGKTMYNESVMMISKDGGAPEAKLLFKPKQILSVTDAGLQTTYVKGVDWDYKDDKLVLLPGSKAVSMKYTELYPDSAKKSFPKRGGGKVLFAEGAFFHNKQLAVTYTHGKNEWEGLKPVFQKDNLTVALDLLKQKKPMRILLFGDSISEGANASGQSNAAPNLPTWGTLIVEKLKSYYQTNIEFTNTAVGGKNSDWGRETVEENVNAYSPDLVIIAFGMNDGTGKMTAAKFKDNIQAMIKSIKAKKPDTEFILVSTMLPNPESMFLGTQPEYTQVLQELTEKGIVLVDMTAVHRELLKHKSYEDLTGNNINHPNDFLIRWYAQEIAGVLMP